MHKLLADIHTYVCGGICQLLTLTKIVMIYQDWIILFTMICNTHGIQTLSRSWTPWAQQYSLNSPFPWDLTLNHPSQENFQFQTS